MVFNIFLVHFLVRKLIFMVFSAVWQYTGPLIVMDTKLGSYLKEKSPWSVCLFCGETKIRMTQHLRLLHKNEKRMKDLEGLSRKLQEEGTEHLVREGNYRRNNLRASATLCGVLIPVRRTPLCRPPQKITHCQHCFAALDTTHFSRHVANCKMALSTENECTAIGQNIVALDK